MAPNGHGTLDNTAQVMRWCWEALSLLKIPFNTSSNCFQEFSPFSVARVVAHTTSLFFSKLYTPCCTVIILREPPPVWRPEYYLEIFHGFCSYCSSPPAHRPCGHNSTSLFSWEKVRLSIFYAFLTITILSSSHKFPCKMQYPICRETFQCVCNKGFCFSPVKNNSFCHSMDSLILISLWSLLSNQFLFQKMVFPSNFVSLIWRLRCGVGHCQMFFTSPSRWCEFLLPHPSAL